WLIEHHPENEVSCLYSMAILPRKSVLNDEADFERAQTLWREQVRRHADSPQVLSNAADFFSSTGSDLELAIELYKRSRESSKPPATYLTGQKLTSLYSRILIATLMTSDTVTNLSFGILSTKDPFRNPALAEKIRQEVESGSDTSLLMGVASTLRNIAGPAALYPAGRPHPLFREEHPELAPVFEYGDRLWKRAEDLGLIRKILPPGTRILLPTAPRNVSPAPVPKTAEPASKPMRIRVGGNVQQAMLAKRVEPVYPPAAVEAQVTGVVTLSVILTTEGKVQQIQAMDGHPVLVPAAMEAVKQWEYKPTLLNGKPVEVATTIEVRFEPPAQPKP
ncbi:MAG: energy transducer TonB, partial [Acidobacteriales bacterium]|nr:energy transducer TonB [Terriglobales bacterium]